jgi:zinc protease
MNAALQVLHRVIAATAVGAVMIAAPAGATDIERIVSPGGIEAWLVQERTVPLVAMDFAFRGGAVQDPLDKPGVASMTAALIDEGAGELDSAAYHQMLEAKAIELSFAANRDYFAGSLRTLTENKEQAFDMVRLSLTQPRFEAPDVERIRDQIQSLLRRETTSPNEIASRRWWGTAFAGHPYGQPVRGTTETVAALTADDLRAYVKNVFARDTLKIAIVGNIDAAAAGVLIDRTFGGLPATGKLAKIALASPQALGRNVAIDLDVPQSVLLVGGLGISRKDPDFMAAYLVNHILGGGSFSSRLYREVREVRGLAYSVYSMLVPLDHSALFLTSTATRADRTKQTLDVVEEEIRRLAETGPTDDELAKAKSFLKGSYALHFDTSSKVASQLVQIQLDELGIDYINRRNSLVDAVTLADVKRVAKRLLDAGMLTTVVGRPQVSPVKSGG